MTDEPKVREIFRYHDGERDRAIDPIAAHRRLGTHGNFKLDSDPALVDAGDLEAQNRMLLVVREVFGLKEWSEDADGNQHGSTDSETAELFVRFLEYLVGVKKNTSQTLTSPAVTALTSPEDASQAASAEVAEATETAEAAGTNESLDSGSTDAGPTSAPSIDS